MPPIEMLIVNYLPFFAELDQKSIFISILVEIIE